MKPDWLFSGCFIVYFLILVGCETKRSETISQTNNADTILVRLNSTTVVSVLKRQKLLPPKKNKRIRVLLTGDSMIGCLLAPIQKADTLERYRFYFSGWYGSTSKDWAKSDSLRKLIAIYKPDYVFFTVGANELLYYSLKKREIYFDSIRAQFGNTNYIFIGAPNWKPAEEYYQILSTKFPENQLFISKDLPLERKKDKAHPTNNASLVWTDTLCTWLATKSKYQSDFYFRKVKP